MSDPTPTVRHTPASRFSAGVLVVLMLISALMIWIGIPLLWLIIGSHTVKSSQPSMGPYALVFFGILVSVIIMALIIGRLNRAYQRLTGTAQMHVQLKWLKSMRGEREDSGTQTRAVLDVVMVTSVVLAGAAAGIWFLFFAGSSLPGT